MRDEIRVFLHENFSRITEIEFLGMITGKFAMHPCPNQSAIGIDIYLGHAQSRGRQIILFVHTVRRRIKLSACRIDPFHLRFRHAR